ncbi:trehalase family glycosidase [Paraburkholderia sp. 40]|uniref:trehalase family glycosidase n=1 Tax=Paraburkholderia sp. 40 TaxID=2991059 RepID=UPI003D1D0DEE
MRDFAGSRSAHPATPSRALVASAFKEMGAINTRFGGDASDKSAGGGEYPLQDGFGWTNGVLRVLMQLYPDAVSSTKRADLPGGAVGVSDAAVSTAAAPQTSHSTSRAGH